MKKISILTILAAMLTFSSCKDDPILGCTDSTAINYDALATENDGSCEYPLLGCMDSLATNYDALATAEDESCLYFSDLIIGSWNYVTGLSGIPLSQETMAMIQMMDPNDFSFEFGVPMPSNEDEWNIFYETIFAEPLIMVGITFEFDGTNLIMNQNGGIETTNYSFSTLTSFEVGENSFGISYFDVLNCTETNLVLYTEMFNEVQESNNYIKITLSK